MSFLRNIRASLPLSRTVHGVAIQKAPVGRYLDAMATLRELPGQLMEACFPGQSVGDLLGLLSAADSETITTALSRAVTVAPRPALAALCHVIGMDTAELDRLTPKELVDVWKAFWEVNELSDFFIEVRRLLKPLLGGATVSKT